MLHNHVCNIIKYFYISFVNVNMNKSSKSPWTHINQIKIVTYNFGIVTIFR